MRPARSPWPRRLAWLLGLWLAGVCAVSAAALGIRWLMRAVGLA